MSLSNNAPEVGSGYIRYLIGAQVFCYFPSIFTIDELLSGAHLISTIGLLVFVSLLYRERIVREINNKVLTFIHYGMFVNSLLLARIFRYFDIWEFNVPVFVLGLIIWLTLIYKNVRIR